MLFIEIRETQCAYVLEVQLHQYIAPGPGQMNILSIFLEVFLFNDIYATYADLAVK